MSFFDAPFACLNTTAQEACAAGTLLGLTITFETRTSFHGPISSPPTICLAQTSGWHILSRREATMPHHSGVPGAHLDFDGTLQRLRRLVEPWERNLNAPFSRVSLTLTPHAQWVSVPPKSLQVHLADLRDNPQGDHPFLPPFPMHMLGTFLLPRPTTAHGKLRVQAQLQDGLQAWRQFPTPDSQHAWIPELPVAAPGPRAIAHALQGR